ncbi:golgin subfamily A member 6-like protein 22 [Prorops nasuta]|uniref:golgin subfamily A member 6-like protein 22 n=1 Tax=Prorops nasuta TaxID=863751 RepID=UPI0034CF5C96
MKKKQRQGEGRKGGSGGGEGGGRKEKKEGIKIAFWNVAGVTNKEEDFWNKVKEWDVVGMVETWVEEKGWKGIKGKLPRGYKWWMQKEWKEEKKGRAKGGIIIGVRKEMEGRIKGGEEDEEGIMEVEVRIKGERWRVVTVYVGKGIRGMEEGLKRIVEREQGKKVIIGGDWNARTGELGGGEGEHEGMEGERMSRDKVINTEGKRMMNVIGEMGLEIWNGRAKGDEEGEYTYVGHMGNSVIDYVVGGREVREELKEMEVEVRTESDHLPMVVTLKRERERRRGTKWGETREIGWMKEDRERYRRKTEEMREETEEGVEGRWRRVQEKVKEIEQEDGMAGDGVWSRGMGMGRERKGRSNGGKVREVGSGSRMGNARIYDKRRNEEGENEDQSGKEGMGFLGETERRKGK